MTDRICTSCGQSQPLANYHVDQRGPGGRRGQCKSCRSLAMKDWYAANQVRQRDRQRARFAANGDVIREQDMRRYERHKPERVELAKLTGNRRRAREAGAEFDQTVGLDGLRERDGDACCYCGVTMTFDLMLAHSYDPVRATLEHVTPISRGGGHTWENTSLACWRCNISKGNQTVEEWRGDTPRGTYLDRAPDTPPPVDATG